MWPHTVTIWRRGADESYTAEVVTGCLWEDRRGEQLRKTGASASNGVKVYMPITAAIQAGDYAAKGEGYGAVRTAKDIVALGGLRVSEADRLDFGRRTIFIISCNERIIASCSFNLTFNTSTL